MLRWTMMLGWMVAFAFVGISAVINALFLSSLGRTVVEASVLAVLSVVADTAKAILPLLMMAAWRNGHRKTAGLGGSVFIALIGLSVMSGMGFAAMTRSAVAAGQDMTALEVNMTTSAIRRNEASLAALGAVRPANVIEAELAAAMADRLWGLSQACVGPTTRAQRDHCGIVARLHHEHGSALAAGRLEGELRELRARLVVLRERGASSAGDPQATAAAELLGISPQAARLGVTLALALVIELGAVAFVLIMAAAAVNGVAGEQQINRSEPRETREAASTVPAVLPLPPKSRQWLKRQQALRDKGNGKDGVHAAT